MTSRRPNLLKALYFIYLFGTFCINTLSSTPACVYYSTRLKSFKATKTYTHARTPACQPAAWQVMNSGNLMSLESLEEKQKLSNYFFRAKCAGQVASDTYVRAHIHT